MKINEINRILVQLRHGLIVSCQAEGASPFNNPEDVAKFALCAQMGGAVAIRAEGIEKVCAIRSKVDLPVIGLVKSVFEDGSVKITGREKDVQDLVDAGCDIVAIDGTFRLREGKTGPGFIASVIEKFSVPVMADISSFEEGLACAALGATCLGTTLSGYTPGTADRQQSGPDLGLLRRLTGHFQGALPVVAEGRYDTPELVRLAIEAGAWAVVVGTAITRPQVVTKWFCDAIKK